MSLGQIFQLTHLGHILENSSEEVFPAICGAKWYEIRDKNKLNLYTMMLIRAHTPCQLKAWKFVILNHAIFTQVLNKAYSYFGVLKALVK